MKRSFTYLALLLATAIITSCSSSFITKRRYTKGYYVQHHAKSHNTQVYNKSAADYSIAASTHVMARPQNNPVADPYLEKKANTAVSASGASVTKAPLNKKSLASPKIAPQSVPADLVTSRPFKPLNNLVKAAKPFHADVDDALSLFWVVILVILILWLLGLIGGVGGGLINLLLLVALILLILWLLRVL